MSSDERAIRLEREAVERLHDCLETIRADLQWYWHWGDGEGGYVLAKLADVVREEGHDWPFDRRSRPPQYTKSKISKKLSRRVMERDAYRCVTCGTHIDLCCDHIIPESRGGETSFDNLQTMCRPCNSRKGAKMPEGKQ